MLTVLRNTDFLLTKYILNAVMNGNWDIQVSLLWSWYDIGGDATECYLAQIVFNAVINTYLKLR